MIIKTLISLILLVSTAPIAAQDGFFDPERDPILSEVSGRIRLVQTEDVIVRAADIRIGKLHPTVETFEKLQVKGIWYLNFECRFAPDTDQSAKVYLKLRPDGNGNHFADTAWIACVGRPCGNCDLDLSTETCFCKTDRPGEPGVLGDCNQVWSTDPLLRRVPKKRE